MEDANLRYDPTRRMLGGFSSNDGTVEFFGRINALLERHFSVLDLGAGRGAWYAEDRCRFRRDLRDIRSKVMDYIGADVDEAVLGNPTTSRNLMIRADGRIPLADESIDLVICDYVLEHIRDVNRFRDEVARIIKPGGFFCGRTPHVLNYVAIAARLINNVHHAQWLRWSQPNRKEVDIFPTSYRCNTRRQLAATFPDWEHFSYLYTAEPQYYFGSRLLYSVFSALHYLGPRRFSGNIFIFIRKPGR